jgi:hypothetical protein
MNHYNFGKVTCASGESKVFECDAANFLEARALLVEFVRNN